LLGFHVAMHIALFMMPLHRPERDYAAWSLRMPSILHADRVGFARPGWASTTRQDRADQATVTAKLAALRQHVGPFDTLLAAFHNGTSPSCGASDGAAANKCATVEVTLRPTEVSIACRCSLDEDIGRDSEAGHLRLCAGADIRALADFGPSQGTVSVVQIPAPIARALRRTSSPAEPRP